MGRRQGVQDMQVFFRVEAKNMGQMFKVNRIYGKSDIFLFNIGHSFETSEWICLKKTIIMCQIVCGSDVLKEKVGYTTRKERYSSFC